MRSKAKSPKRNPKAPAAAGKSASGHPAYELMGTDVVELSDHSQPPYMGTDGAIFQLKNGTLMLAQGGGIIESSQKSSVYRISKDDGKTWSEPRSLGCEMGVGGIIRLQSGVLAVYGRKAGASTDVYFCSSKDEGKTWTHPLRIPTYPDFHPMFHSMVQLSNGRLLLTGYWEARELDCHPPDLLPITDTRWGWWRGVELFMEGHRAPEMGICKVYYSDDEGAGWKECHGGLLGWFNEEGVPDGTIGITDVYEPTLAETKDGRVLLFARCRRGRIVQSYSLDQGQTWYSMQPTELASSQAPPMLVRIPSNGDLLCVWNQVSGEEIRRGFHRGRLSAAISKDSGLTWGHFKTIELQEGMEDGGRIAPDFPILANVRGNPGLGQLPDGFAMFTYPNVDIVGQTVFVRYMRMRPVWLNRQGKKESSESFTPRMWPREEDKKAEMKGEGVMRIYPLRWFYE